MGAKVYRAPTDFVPDYRATDWRAREDAYIADLAAQARRARPADKLAGRVISWQRADGFARYMVWSSSPLALVHLDLGDGYSVEAALLRGLRVTDVKAKVAADDRLAAYFADKATEKARA